MDLALDPRVHHRRPRPQSSQHPLQQRLALHVERSVLDLLEPRRLRAFAEDLGAVQRQRKHDAGLMVCAFILSSFERSTDTQGRLLDAQVTYQQLGGPSSGKTSFRNKAHLLVPVFHELLKRQMRRLSTVCPEDEMRGRLAGLADVLIPDGCAFKLATALSGIYRGTGTAAELKLHAVYSVKAGACLQDERTAGSVHDSKEFWPDPWEPHALYLWDLGYQNNARFIEAIEAKSHVLQRLKELSNPVVLASYGPTGARRAIERDDGSVLRLNEACEFGYVHKQPVLDLDVEIVDPATGHKVVARVVCVPHQGQDRYYLTDLSRELFTPYDLAELYRLRWEVELLFRLWKGAVRLDEVRRMSHDDSLDVVVTSSLLAALLARDIHAGLERMTREQAALEAAFPPGEPASAILRPRPRPVPVHR